MWGLLGLNLVIGVFQFVMGEIEDVSFVYRFGVIPVEITGDDTLASGRFRGPEGTVLVNQASPIPTWATMFSSMFLHGGLLHLGGNMVYRWVFGDNIEIRFGHWRFLTFYLLAGGAAVWAQVYVDPTSDIPMVGASGAIAGEPGAYMVLFPRSKVDSLVVLGFIMHVRVAALILIGAWIALQLLNDAGSLGVVAGGVAYFAHVGGFAAGAAFSLGFRPLRSRRGGSFWEPLDAPRRYGHPGGPS
jgi:membrane associated rhomboid family serine protease